MEELAVGIMLNLVLWGSVAVAGILVTLFIVYNIFKGFFALIKMAFMGRKND